MPITPVLRDSRTEREAGRATFPAAEGLLPKALDAAERRPDWAFDQLLALAVEELGGRLGAIAYVRKGSTTEHLAATLQRAIDARARLAQVEYS